MSEETPKKHKLSLKYMTVTGESPSKGWSGRNSASLGTPELPIPRVPRPLQKMCTIPTI